MVYKSCPDLSTLISGSYSADNRDSSEYHAAYSSSTQHNNNNTTTNDAAHTAHNTAAAVYGDNDDDDDDHIDKVWMSINQSVKVKRSCIAVKWNPISQLGDVTCHMGSYGVTLHPTSEHTPA